MLLNHGVQSRLILESTTGAGSTSKEVSVESDSALVTLNVTSLASGTLSVVVYGLAGTDIGAATPPLITFPVVSAPTTNLLLRAASLVTQRLLVVATYTGVCSYEIQVRAVNGASGSTKILASDSLSMSQITVGTSVIAIIPASLADRAGVIVKNWSPTQTVYVGATAAEAVPGVGYPLAPKDALALDVSAGVAIYGVSDAPGADLRLAQSGG